MTKQKILVVDDEPSIAKLIDFNLKTAGYEVRCVHDGESVFPACTDFEPDLIVLDLMLPRTDGIGVCRKLRSMNNHVPVIMLTALNDLSDKIAGLDNGADDYMTKPFSPQELVSRIRAVLRRAKEKTEGGEEPLSLMVGGILMHPESREVYVHGRLIDLSPKEYDLLYYLCRHPGKVLTREQLLQGVWNYDYPGETRIVDVHISHLRDKVETNPRTPEYIITVRSVGYKLSDYPAAKRIALQADSEQLSL
jgi:two-component system alkaline phosphatase synthesis response regulator PhoP